MAALTVFVALPCAPAFADLHDPVLGPGTAEPPSALSSPARQALVIPSPPQGLPAILGLPFSFHYDAYAALTVPAGWAPYGTSTACARAADVNSVTMKMIDGKLYDQPASQASTGYANLNAYRLTSDDFYLQHARAQADRLIACRVSSSGAWFYPYRFNWRLDRRTTVQAPWYSAMSQGMALGLFSRLYQVTGLPKYKQAADLTFASFLVAPSAGKPWVVDVDPQGYLCLEEYPGTTWRFVFNGHMYAAFGLYDYYLASGDARALKLYQGALTAVVHYAPALRQPGWLSAYSLGVRSAWASYQVKHLAELLQLFTITGDETFADLADAFAYDYANPTAVGQVWVATAEVTGYCFSSSGAVVAQRSIALSQPTQLPVSNRRRVRGQPGYWFAVSGGDLAGYSIREIPGSIYFCGQVGTLTYLPGRGGALLGGEVVGTQFDECGNVTATLAATVPAAAATTIRQRATINGTPFVLLLGGDLNGYWVPQAALRDTAAPTTTACGSGWFSRDAKVMLSATDLVSDVRESDFAIDGGPWTSGTSAVIPLSLGQGAHIVSYRSIDNQGNVEETKTCTVGIDTRRPTPRAPSTAIATHGRTASLRFAVMDPRPGGPSAAVTIRIVSANGRTVKTVHLASQRVQVWLTYAFRCTLAKETYRFFVAATDASGNKGTTFASNVLVVR
jgi:hypothetical protein